MKRVLIALVVCLLTPVTLLAQNSSGQKPQWIDKPHILDNKRSNESYYFKVVPNSGPNLQELRATKVKALGSYIMTENKIEGVEGTTTENTQSDNAMSSITYIDKATNQRKTITFYHKLVDEYWEWNGQKYLYWALFAVSDNGSEPRFDTFSYSTSYGAAPVAMSLIPGVGQIYKGSTIKGICMLGGVVALGLGALLCENTRSDYKNKMKEQPEFAQTYNTKANNYETARNILIGATAAVYIYNLIDAAVAKGARRIIVKPANGSYVSLHPIVTPNSAGISLAYNF